MTLVSVQKLLILDIIVNIIREHIMVLALRTVFPFLDSKCSIMKCIFFFVNTRIFDQKKCSNHHDNGRLLIQNGVQLILYGSIFFLVSQQFSEELRKT